MSASFFASTRFTASSSSSRPTISWSLRFATGGRGVGRCCGGDGGGTVRGTEKAAAMDVLRWTRVWKRNQRACCLADKSLFGVESRDGSAVASNTSRNCFADLCVAGKISGGIKGTRNVPGEGGVAGIGGRGAARGRRGRETGRGTTALVRVAGGGGGNRCSDEDDEREEDGLHFIADGRRETAGGTGRDGNVTTGEEEEGGGCRRLRESTTFALGRFTIDDKGGVSSDFRFTPGESEV